MVLILKNASKILYKMQIIKEKIMEKIIVNAKNVTGKIKALHGVCNVPWASCTEELERNYLGLYKEAGIPYCRYHDMGGVRGGEVYVDIPNIFRDFDADETNPENYDFTFTDWLVNRCVENGVEPFYRLGITIENDNFYQNYYNEVPKDKHKWARICEHIIAHYNEGWANGYKYNIEYWEIWNEPEVRGSTHRCGDEQMWNGSAEDYFELYSISATYLKERFPNIKVGGYSSIGFYHVIQAGISPSQNVDHAPDKVFTYFHDFMKYISARKIPLDFFSWHSYHCNPQGNAKMSVYVKTQLIRYGYPDCENINDEWNPDTRNRGLLVDCSNIASNMLAYQKNMLDKAMYYALRLTSGYNGMLHPVTGKPLKAYYAFKAFNAIYRLENELETLSTNEDIYVGAAEKDGKLCLMISNYLAEDKEIEVEIEGFSVKEAKINRVDEENTYDESVLEASSKLQLKLPAHAVYLLTFNK